MKVKVTFLPVRKVLRTVPSRDQSRCFRNSGKSLLSQTFLYIICTIWMTKAAFGAEMVRLSLTYDGKPHAYVAEPVHLMLNGDELSGLPMPPVILQGNTYIPAREIFEPLGGIVDWNNAKREVYIAYDRNMVVLQMDNKIANVNGNKIQMSMAPKIINNKAMIPIRFAAESVGLNVAWDGKTRVAAISTPEYKETQGASAAPVVTAQPDQTQTVTTDTATTDADLAVGAADTVQTGVNSSQPAVVSITTPGGDNRFFSINLAGQAEKIEQFFADDNRLVVDVYNTEMKVAQKTMEVNHPIVKTIRVAQNQVTPKMVTRVVFDLNAKHDCNASLSPDKKSVIVSFEKNTIQNIDFSTNAISDCLRINGTTKISAEVTKMVDPMRLVIDIPNAVLSLGDKTFTQGKYVNAVRYSQFTPDTVRVVLETNNNFNFKINETGNGSEINITDVSFKNIYYDNQNKRFRITKNQANPIDIKTITFKEQILNHAYVVNFNTNLEGFLGYGEYSIMDDCYQAVHIQTNMNNTALTFDEKQAFEYTVTEDASNVYINFIKPTEKYKRIVVLDAGHGGKDTGATSNGLSEKDLTLDIVLKTKEMLEQSGTIKVYTTRDADVYPTLSDRTVIANPRGDFFVSVHINSAGTNTSAKGTEVYYLNPNDTGTGLTSGILADTLQRNLIQELNSSDRKIKTANFQVLRESKIPAALVEVGFITNYEEAQNLSSSEYRQKVAVALYNSIVELFDKYPRN